MSDQNKKLSFFEKAGYSLSDASANFVFQTLMFYQQFFYTDVFGLSATAASWLFLFVRISDAITDPIMGVMADRTKTRWGKYRPWLLWSAIPFSLFFWAAFTTPSWAGDWKLIYAYVTYTLMMMAYTANNVPYSALNGVMTGNVDERTSLSQYRFVAAMGAALIVQGFTRPLADKLGNGDAQLGWSLTMGIFATISLIFFVITFFSVKERVQPPANQKPQSVSQNLKDAFGNVPWRVLSLATVFIFITLSFRGGMLNYFYQYYLSRESLGEFLQAIGLGAGDGAPTGFRYVLDLFGLILRPDGSNIPSVGFGVTNMLGNLVTIAGVLCSKQLSEWFGKRTVFGVSLAVTAVVTTLPFFIPADQVGWHIAAGLLWSAAYGPSIPLLWSMMGDVADHAEWQHHRRSTAFMFAGVVFALKAGLSLGGFIAPRVLDAYGYVAGAEQTPTSLLGIRLSATVYPSIFLVLAAIVMIFFPISRQVALNIQDELIARRKAAGESIE